MRQLFAYFMIFIISATASANKYTDSGVSTNVLDGARGTDDTAMAVMVTVAFFGSIIIWHIAAKRNESPLLKMFIFLLGCIALTYVWVTSN